MTDAQKVIAMRVLAVSLGLVLLTPMVGWLAAAQWANAILPWPEVRMTYIFMASIGAATGVIWLAVALQGELVPMAGIGLTIAVIAAGGTAVLIEVGQRWPLMGSIGSVFFGLGLFAWSRRQHVTDRRPMPRVVRASFVVFIVVLVVAGGLLVARQQIFPWRLQSPTQLLAGSFFLGAASYFAYSVARGGWVHAGPALWAFLAYDLVLFVPYLRLLGPAEVEDVYGDGAGAVNFGSLAIYLAVLTYSTLLALYYLLVHPATRWIRSRAPARS